MQKNLKIAIINMLLCLQVGLVSSLYLVFPNFFNVLGLTLINKGNSFSTNEKDFFFLQLVLQKIYKELRIIPFLNFCTAGLHSLLPTFYKGSNKY